MANWMQVFANRHKKIAMLLFALKHVVQEVHDFCLALWALELISLTGFTYLSVHKRHFAYMWCSETIQNEYSKIAIFSTQQCTLKYHMLFKLLITCFLCIQWFMHYSNLLSFIYSHSTSSLCSVSCFSTYYPIFKYFYWICAWGTIYWQTKKRRNLLVLTNWMQSPK